MLKIDVNSIAGLSEHEAAAFQELLKVYNYHYEKNIEKNKYYEGKIRLGEVNLGIALPEDLNRLEIGCSWGAKTVDVLAGLSMFDGFVGPTGDNVPELDKIVADNRLLFEYEKISTNQLKYGAVFATLSADPEIGCKIRFHSPLSAAALWNGEKGRIDCGFAVIDTVADESKQSDWVPNTINFHTDEAIIVLRRNKNAWSAERYPHKMGRPLMEPLIYSPTTEKPFGRSRIKEPIRRLIQGFVRTVANATIGLEFATAPQKYLLGVTDDQYDALINQKFKQYVGSIITSTNNPETGEAPKFGQLPQGSIAPHVDMMRILATQFSAATGLTVTDTGIVNDANPTSSEAIEAQSRTLIGMAERMNSGNGEALRSIARMALAISENKKLDELDPEKSDVVASFKNPAMPSIAVTADAAIKIASARKTFAETDMFLKMLGFDQAAVRQIKAQEQRTRGIALFESIEAE